MPVRGLFMNIATIFTFGLAHFFGLFIFILAVVLFSRKDYYCKIILNLKDDNPIIMLTATIGLLLGIILIGVHGGVFLQYRVLITILCWFVFINSLLWLMMPEKMLKLTKKMFKGRGFYIFISILLILGFLLVFRGSLIFITRFG